MIRGHLYTASFKNIPVRIKIRILLSKYKKNYNIFSILTKMKKRDRNGGKSWPSEFVKYKSKWHEFKKIEKNRCTVYVQISIIS